MKKYRVKVIREDEYEIEFDENKINKEWMADFRDFMYPFKDLEEHAEHLAQYEARIGDAFIEGYGVVKRNGKFPYPYNTEEHKDTCKEDGINIKVISEDNRCDVEVEELL